MIGYRMASAHVLDKVGGDILLTLDSGATVLTIGFDIAGCGIDFVGGYVEMRLNYARRLRCW